MRQFDEDFFIGRMDTLSILLGKASILLAHDFISFVTGSRRYLFHIFGPSKLDIGIYVHVGYIFFTWCTFFLELLPRCHGVVQITLNISFLIGSFVFTVVQISDL